MNQRFTPDQAWPKIKHFCAYRERCRFETTQKLVYMGLLQKEADAMIGRLVEEGSLDEERFAIQFAGGHFRQKKWGKQKILYALKQKRVSEIIIKRALQEIDGKDYIASLQKLALAKWESLKGEHYLTRQVKTIAYLQQKGYEGPMVREVISGLRNRAIE